MFKLPLSDEEKYWVGYLRADGAILRRPSKSETAPLRVQKVLAFGQKHREPVEELAQFLGDGNTIHVQEYKSFDRPTTMFVLHNFKVGYALDELGLKTDLNPILYTSYHFWRGLMDGDGSVGNYVRKRTGLIAPSLSCSGSEIDMTLFAEWIGSLFSCKPPSVHSGVNHRVALGGSKARAVALYLYEGEYSALKYKQEIALAMKDWKPKRITTNTVGG